MTLHYVPLHYINITIHYIYTLHTYITYMRTYIQTDIHTRYITLHHITCITYITGIAYITLHYITLHYITLHYITLHLHTLHTYLPWISYIHTCIHKYILYSALNYLQLPLDYTTYIRTCMHACMHTYIHTYIDHIHTCIHTYMHT